MLESAIVTGQFGYSISLIALVEVGEGSKIVMSAHSSITLEKIITLSCQGESVGDRRYVFLKCYGMMTANMFSAIDRGQFNDSAWVHILLENFANYYFRALEAYQAVECASPRVWQIAFQVADRSEFKPVQHLLLGVNAHINYDLVFAVVDLIAPEWNRLTVVEQAARYEDYCLVNDIIRQTIDAVQDDILEKDNPLMSVIDIAMFRVDEWLISRFVNNWRDQVWSQAIKLTTSEDEHETVVLQDKVETRALHLARWIMGYPIAVPKDDLGKLWLSP